MYSRLPVKYIGNDIREYEMWMSNLGIINVYVIRYGIVFHCIYLFVHVARNARNHQFRSVLYHANLLCVLVPLGPLSFGLWSLMALLTAPVAIVKSGISLVHLYAASQNIVAIDLEDRAKLGKKQ